MKNLYRILGLSCALGFLQLTSAAAGGLCHIACTDYEPVDIDEPNRQTCCDQFNLMCNGYGTAYYYGGGFPVCPNSAPPS